MQWRSAQTAACAVECPANCRAANYNSPSSIGDKHANFLSLGHRAHKWKYCRVCDTQPVRRQTSGYLPRHLVYSVAGKVIKGTPDLNIWMETKTKHLDLEWSDTVRRVIRRVSSYYCQEFLFHGPRINTGKHSQFKFDAELLGW